MPDRKYIPEDHENLIKQIDEGRFDKTLRTLARNRQEDLLNRKLYPTIFSEEAEVTDQVAVLVPKNTSVIFDRKSKPKTRGFCKINPLVTGPNVRSRFVKKDSDDLISVILKMKGHAPLKLLRIYLLKMNQYNIAPIEHSKVLEELQIHKSALLKFSNELLHVDLIRKIQSKHVKMSEELVLHPLHVMINPYLIYPRELEHHEKAIKVWEML